MSDESRIDNDAGDSAVVTLHGTVDKIIPAVGSQPEKAQIASGVSAKPAMRGHFKTGHMRWPGT